MAVLALTSCGCLRLYRDAPVTELLLVDSNVIPRTDINIGWISFDGTEYPIEQVFEDFTDLLSYLNTTFVSALGIDGLFELNGNYIEYTNPEGFQTGEIMAILQNYMLRFAVGNAEPLNVAVISVANSNVITDISLQGVEILNVQVNIQNSEPKTATGWIHNSGTGTLTFPADNPPENSNVYVLTKQPTA